MTALLKTSRKFFLRHSDQSRKCWRLKPDGGEQEVLHDQKMRFHELPKGEDEREAVAQRCERAYRLPEVLVARGASGSLSKAAKGGTRSSRPLMMAVQPRQIAPIAMPSMAA